MTKVFISYSRKDKAFAGRLTESLQKSELETWIDWEDIPPTADWMDQIHKGIEQADAFLFLLSPDSVASKVCGEEANHAVQNGKRLIPIVVRDVNPDDVHIALGKVNWIYGREGDDFDGAVNKTLLAIRTDLAWVESRRRLQVRALEWDKRKDGSLLLRGKDLREAEERLASVGQKDPQPTDLQRRYILESRRGESRTRNLLLVISAVVMVVLAIASVVAVRQSNYATEQANTAVAANSTAVREANIRATAQANAEIEKQNAIQQAKNARAGELTTQSITLREKNFLLSLLLGVEAFQTSDIPQSHGILLDNLRTNLQLRKFLHYSGNSMVLWDAETKQFVPHSFLGLTHSSFIGQSNGVLSPDGKMLAIISDTDVNTIILRDAATGNSIGTLLAGNIFGVSAMAFSPDGTILASSTCGKEEELGRLVCTQGEIFLWNVATQRLVGQMLKGHTTDISALVFSLDGTILASSSFESSLSDNKIILWDAATQQPIGQPLKGSASYALAFSPDGKTLAAGSFSGPIILWDVTTRKSIGQPLTGHTDSVNSLAFDPHGVFLASGSDDKTVILWNISTGQPVIEPLIGQPDAVNKVEFSPDGQTLASSSANDALLWDMSAIMWDSHYYAMTQSNENDPNPIRRQITGSDIDSLALSPDGKILAANTMSSSTDYSITFWDTKTRQPNGEPIKGFTNWTDSMAFSPDGKILALGSQFNDTISLWDVTSRKLMDELPAGQDGVYNMAFSPDGKILASGSYWGATVILWDLTTRKPIGQPLTGQSVAFSPDGKTLASGGDSITIWDIATHQPVGQPFPIVHTDVITRIAFSPDGNILVSGGRDNTIVFWDVTTHQPIGQPIKVNDSASRTSMPFVNDIAFSPDGKILAAGSDGSLITLWDTATHQPIGQPLPGRVPYGGGLVFSPDGTTLYSGNMGTGVPEDTAIILWDLDPRFWIKKTCQRAGRNFTRAEWALYFPNEEYRAACPQYPLESDVTVTPMP